MEIRFDMRKVIAFILFFFMRKRILHELNRNDSILAIYGHDCSKKSFQELIEWLLKNGYDFITHHELFDFLNGKMVRCDKKVWLSFDDGWKSNYENIYPLLIKYNIPATIFVATKGIEDGYYWFSKAFQNRKSKYYKELQELWEMPNSMREKIIVKLPDYRGPRLTMNKFELHEMAESGLVSLGNHTHDHVISNCCTEDELLDQINLCKTKLREWTGMDGGFIYSYPNGNRDNNSEKIIKGVNFKMAVTTEIGRVYSNTDSFSIPRTEFKDNGCLKENILQIYGLWTPFFNSIKRKLNIVNKK